MKIAGVKEFRGDKVGVANFFFEQSIGIDENKTFQLKFLFYQWRHYRKRNLLSYSTFS